jgi:hypothetical protein
MISLIIKLRFARWFCGSLAKEHVSLWACF